MLCRCQLLPIAVLVLVVHTKTLEKMDGILTKLRFLSFSQSCFLRNTADLLDFMLHLVLSIASVKIVCCHNAIPQGLRGELTSGSLQIYIWRLSLSQTLSFTYPLQKKLVSTLTEDIIIHSEPKKIENMSKIRFRKNFKACQLSI